MLALLVVLVTAPPLPEGAVAALGSPRFRLDVNIDRFDFSPDESLVAVEAEDVTVFDASTGTVVRRFSPFAYIETTKFLNDGALALVGMSDDETEGTQLLIVDPRTGTERRRVRFEAPLPGGPHVCPDGLLLAADNDAEHRVELFSCTTGRRVADVKFRDGDAIGQVAFSPCARFLVGLSQNGWAYVFDRRTGAEPCRQKVVNPTGVKFSHDGRYAGIIGGPSGDHVTVLDLAAAALVGTVESKPSSNWAAFGPKGHLWIGTDLWTDAYDPAAGLKKQMPRPRGRITVYDAHVSRDGATVTANTGHGALIRYAAATGEARPESAAVFGGFLHSRLSFPGRNRVVAFATEQGSLGFDTRTGRMDTVTTTGTDDFAVLTRDETLVAVNTTEAVELRSPKSGKVRKRFPHADDDRVSDLQFSPDGKHLVGKLGEGMLRVWDVAAGSAQDFNPGNSRPILTYTAGPGAIVVTVPEKDDPNADPDTARYLLKRLRYEGGPAGDDVPLEAFLDLLQVSADGRTVVGLGGGNFGRAGTNSVRGYDTVTGKRLFANDLEYATQAAAITPDGRGVVYGQLGDLVVVETRTGRERFRRAVSARTEVGGVAVSPDGRFAATTAGAIPVLIWDLKAVPPPTDVSPAALWRDLAADAAVAYRAECYLERTPRLAAQLLRDHPLPPPAPADRVKQWAVELDARDYRTRRAAKAELMKHADAAGPLLEGLLKETKSAEKRAALTAVLESRDRLTPDKLRRLRLADVLAAVKAVNP